MSGPAIQVLVCHAGAHGSTREIAGRIAGRLCRAGLRAEVAEASDADAVAGLARWDAVVLGSAIHNGQWLPVADGLARRAAASARPVWPFSVGMVGDSNSALGPRVTRVFRARQPVPDAVAALPALDAARHRRFTGVFRPAHTSGLGRVLYRLMGGRFGDHRDWADVDRWADEIAAALPVLPSVTGGGSSS
ncbi:MAG: flavodoxin domain-containing protein [Pseudonocardia sp.]|jgi:menaquinone-dependent protoporphyrinogen oxidase